MLSKLLVAILLSIPSYASSTADKKVIKLDTDNTVVFRGVVDDGSVIAAQLALAELVSLRGDAQYTIYLVMDTPGGSIIAGEDFIQFAKGVRDLQTISLFSASMGSAIVEALPGRRLVTENGILMFHRAKDQFQGQFEDGEVETELAFFKSVVRTMESRNAARLGLTLEEYKASVKDERWAYGPDNVQQGLADEVVEITCSKELIDVRTHAVQAFFFGSTVETYSGCPLMRAPIPGTDDGHE